MTRTLKGWNLLRSLPVVCAALASAILTAPLDAQTLTLTLTPASGMQLTSTFTVTGSGYTPNGTVRRFVNQPTWGGFREISSIQANGAGQFTFPYTPDCTHPLGTTYLYAIDGQSNRQSPTVSETIFAHPSCTPQISSVSPSQPIADPGDQLITVFGVNFQSGLTVTVGYPGGSSTLAGGQIVNVTPSSFGMWITLGNAVSFSIRVNNPNLTQSNPFTFTASTPPPPPPPQAPTLSVSPTVGTQLTTTFTITGSGYTPNGAVRRFVNQPTWGGFREISSIQANGSGQVSWPYTPDCTNAPGTSYIYTIDSSGRNSATITQTVQANSACTVTISGISPTAPVARPQDQAITVLGSQFQSGLTVTVEFANGGPVTLSGAQIQSVTPASFVMMITLGAPGQFSIRVNNPNGASSNTFSFTAGTSTPAPAPQITHISPQRPIVSGTDQTVTVYGNHFTSGLTVLFDFPTGGKGSVAGIQVPQITPTALTMLARLGDRGGYVIRVRNQDGQESNPFAFSVDPVMPTTGTIEGRVLDDVNGNGQQDAGESFLKAPALSCGGVAQSNLSVTLTGPTERVASLDTCVGNAPYFRSTDLPEGTYTLTLDVPQGARVTNGASRTVSVVAGATSPRVDFRVVRGGTQPPPGSASTDLSVRVVYTTGNAYELTRQDESVSFALDVTNYGAATATGVTLTFFPPPALAFEGLDRGAGACVSSGASVRCPVANIAAGATKTVAAWFRALKAGRQTVDVNAAAAQNETNDANNSPALVAEVVPRHVQPLARCQLVGVDDTHPLDPLKPTVVLTHGWSQHEVGPDGLWTSAIGHKAKGLLDERFRNRVNVVQTFWPAAGTQSEPFMWIYAAYQYREAKAATADAGACIATSLYTELRGDDYAQPIHFIGHSLGTVVNAHAARQFLSSAKKVPSAQMTTLDFPARVYSLWNSVGAGAKKSDNVEKDLFVNELHKVSRILAGLLPVSLDNYYSDDGESFGDKSDESPYFRVHNHPPLKEPGDLDNPYFKEGKGVFKRNHGGVQKWYRLTIAPGVFGINCPGWSGQKTLNPCHEGWHRSIINSAVGPTSAATDDLNAEVSTIASPPAGNAEALVGAPATPLPFDAFLNIDNCELIADVVTCGAGQESKASSLFDIPIGGKYLTFNYRFNNTAGDEYAAVFVDDEPVWVMTARNTSIGKFQTSGALALPARSGRHTLSVLYYGAGQLTSSFELTDLATEAGMPEVAYLAEGATGSFFHTQIALLNPTPDPADVMLQFQREDGTQIAHALTLAGTTRTTIDASTIPGLESANFATRIESTSPIVADRTMTWDASTYGSHAERNIASPSLIWYLAEGATHGNFALFYLLQNPDHVRAADIEVRYLLGQGAPITRTYRVPPASRMNILVDDEPGLAEADVSGVIQVTNGVPIIVERAMYLSRPGQLVSAGHDSAGVTAPQTHWFLAEGATGSFFDTFILIANPNDTDAQVEATYLLPTGQTVVKSHMVRANSRFTIYAAAEDPQLASEAMSTTVESMNDVPIVVERTMWWPARDWQEGHNSPGATSTGTKWALAEGEDGGPRETQTYVLIANTSSFAGVAKVTVVFDDGMTRERTFPLNPSSRFNVAVASEFPEAVGRRFGVIVESLGLPPAEIVVERAMYSNSNGIVWAAGTNALATKLP